MSEIFFKCIVSNTCKDIHHKGVHRIYYIGKISFFPSKDKRHDTNEISCLQIENISLANRWDCSSDKFIIQRIVQKSKILLVNQKREVFFGALSNCSCFFYYDINIRLSLIS